MSAQTVEVPTWVLISAFRYALGRQTYIVADTARLLIQHREAIKPDWRALIIKEIDDAIRAGCAGATFDADEWATCRDALVTAVAS